MLRAKSNLQTFICVSLVNEKFNPLISMFSQSWYIGGIKLVEEDNLLIFYSKNTVVSRTFLFSVNFSLDLFLKRLLLTTNDKSLYLGFLLKFHFIKTNNPSHKHLFSWLHENSINSFKHQLHKMVKHTQIICRLLPTNCLSVFDHFMGLALNELNANANDNFYVQITGAFRDNQSLSEVFWRIVDLEIDRKSLKNICKGVYIY